MFDPRDFTPDPRRTVTRPRRDHGEGARTAAA